MGISIMEKGSDICPTIYLENIILTQDAQFAQKGVTVAHSVEELEELLAEKDILRTLNGEKGGRAKEKGTRKRSLFCQNFLPVSRRSGCRAPWRSKTE